MEYVTIETSHVLINARIDKRAGHELAVLLPGLNYSVDNPLLYYTSQLFHERGVDTLSVDFTYNRDEVFLKDTDENRLERLKSDGQSIIEFAMNLGKYDRLTIVGKSLGTISMGWAVPDNPPNTRLVWLTPSLGGTGLRAQMSAYPNPAFCLIGTRDPGNTGSLVDEIATPNMTVAVIEGADNVFNHDNGVEASVALVQRAINKLAVWLDATD